jgi:hypothetical protein
MSTKNNKKTISTNKKKEIVREYYKIKKAEEDKEDDILNNPLDESSDESSDSSNENSDEISTDSNNNSSENESENETNSDDKLVDFDDATKNDNGQTNKKQKYKKTTKNNNRVFKELIKKQIPDTPIKWKLNINDIKRICKYIDDSIFDPDKCCIWNGYVTNVNNSNKGTYINFYFRNKKVALHRLLYSNFVAPLEASEYLKFNCPNKGICCNINHYEKYKYLKNKGVTKKDTKKPKTHTKEINDICIIGSDDPDKLIIDFD